MKEHPINFNDEMVRAILDGRKTQTRRPVKPQPLYGAQECPYSSTGFAENNSGLACSCHKEISSPFGQPGDRLWVRECWQQFPENGEARAILYRATNPECALLLPTLNGGVQSVFCERWRTSTNMPRWASRITLDIKSVHVWRLHEITSADAIAEGFPSHANSLTIDCDTPDPRSDFADYWDRIYSKKELGWDTNPWVWVVEFEDASV